MGFFDIGRFDPPKAPETKKLGPQYVTIRTVVAPFVSVTALYGPTLPGSSGGVGGWEEVPRPRRQSMTDFKGTPLWTVKIELMIDGLADEESVQPTLGILIQMARKNVTLGSPPPVVYSGEIVPGATQHLWVINNLEWGDAVRRISDGQIIRQVVTVTLLEYVEPIATQFKSVGPANDAQARHDAESAAEAAAASRQAAEDAAAIETAASSSVGDAVATGIVSPGVRPWVPAGSVVDFAFRLLGATPAGSVGSVLAADAHQGRTYTVRASDTLPRIAAEQLGDSTKWISIAVLNRISDPRTIRVGQVLDMPGLEIFGTGAGLFGLNQALGI